MNTVFRGKWFKNSQAQKRILILILILILKMQMWCALSFFFILGRERILHGGAKI